MGFSSFYKKIKNCAIRSKKDDEKSVCETPLQDQDKLPELSPFCDHRAWEGLLPSGFPLCLLSNPDSTNESSGPGPIDEDEDETLKSLYQSEKQGSFNDEVKGTDTTGDTIPPLTLNYELLAQMAQERLFRRRYDTYMINLNGEQSASIHEPASFHFSNPQWRYHQHHRPRTFLLPSVLHMLGNTQPGMLSLICAQLDMSPMLYDLMRDDRYRVYQQLIMNNDNKMT